jgi:hypothetical protein
VAHNANDSISTPKKFIAQSISDAIITMGLEYDSYLHAHNVMHDNIDNEM